MVLSTHPKSNTLSKLLYEIDSSVTEKLSLQVDDTYQQLFSFDSHEVSHAELFETIAVLASQHPEMTITVSGNTDSSGNEEYNQHLSYLRAKAVAQQLEALKVSPERINIKANGELSPQANNKTPEGRRLNRNVHIILSPYFRNELTQEP